MNSSHPRLSSDSSATIPMRAVNSVCFNFPIQSPDPIPQSNSPIQFPNPANFPIQLPDYQIIQLPDSEERDFDYRAVLDGALVCGDLDVPVSLREARDVAGSLERRVGGAVAEADRVELMPVRGRDDAAAERDADGSRRVRRQAGDGPQERHEQNVRIREARRRVSGHPEERGPSHYRERRRLARPDRDAVKDHLAA